MKSIVFDLDDTICFPNHSVSDTHGKYANALPNPPIIEAMRKLHENGYHIIIASARRMVTHANDVFKVMEDVGDITVEWLHANDVPFDELMFGKPYSSTYYVDDKAMTPEMFLQWSKNLV